jgi:hypothetical protein
VGPTCRGRGAARRPGVSGKAPGIPRLPVPGLPRQHRAPSSHGGDTGPTPTDHVWTLLVRGLVKHLIRRANPRWRSCLWIPKGVWQRSPRRAVARSGPHGPGVPATLLDVLLDWNTGRTARLRLGSVEGNDYPVTKGAPQEDALSPLPFMLYIESLLRTRARGGHATGTGRWGSRWQWPCRQTPAMLMPAGTRYPTCACQACHTAPQQASPLCHRSTPQPRTAKLPRQHLPPRAKVRAQMPALACFTGPRRAHHSVSWMFNNGVAPPPHVTTQVAP